MTGYTAQIFAGYKNKFTNSDSTMELVDENTNFMEIDYGMGSS